MEMYAKVITKTSKIPNERAMLEIPPRRPENAADSQLRANWSISKTHWHTPE